jgi:type IV pilus assembly protein PilA
MAIERDTDLDQYVDEPVPPVAPAAKRALSAGPSVAPPSPGKRSQTWVIAVVVIGVVLLGLLPIAAAVAIYGVRRYLVQAKTAEARVAVAAFAKGLARCGAEEGKLPPTSAKVPSDVGSMQGRKYQSSPDDWTDDAFRCAEFRMIEPQYFQYQWVLKDDIDAGSVIATADLDGNGVAEIRLELEVDCTSSSCRVEDIIREGEL